MRKFLLLLLVLTLQQSIQSQALTDKISIEFSNINRKKAIENIENKTLYKFYFDAEWFANDSTLISGQYKETAISTILFDVFNDTDLNFFLIKDKVILTHKSII